MSNKAGHKRTYNNRSKDKNRGQFGERNKETHKDVDDNSPIIKAFQHYALEIDEKHDRYERLVKISRDITIESKRIIFLLHNVDNENKRDSILKEANTRLKKLVSTSFRNIALELENQDPYQYLRAYSPGLQEFVEALTFYQYLSQNTIKDFNFVVNELTYNIALNDDVCEASDESGTKSLKAQICAASDELGAKSLKSQVCTASDESGAKSSKPQICAASDVSGTKNLKARVPVEEYILGIADLTGELMRKCINSLGSGNIENCFTTCNFVKSIYTGFLRVGNTSSYREISKKAYVLKQSLHKMENVCYNIVVRGSEVPKHMLANVISTNTEVCSDEDEGFF